MELAEQYPNDPIAVDALIRAVWQVNSTPWPVELVGKDDAWLRAFALLERDHIRSSKLGPACQRLSFGFCKEYGEVKLPDGGTVGEHASAGLFEIRHLIVGKEAPDIEGEDQDGRKFKLRDYRGKVVLLDFWGEYRLT